MGITAISCTSSTASEARPVSVLVRLRWVAACMAMAVELIASARPMIREIGRVQLPAW